MREVAITGVGVASPFGVGRDCLATACRQRSPLPTQCLPELGSTILADQPVATVPGLADAARRVGGKLVKFMSEQAALACVAGSEAAREADLLGRYPGEAIALFAGTGLTATNYRESEAMLSVCLDEAGEFSPALLGRAGLARMNPLESFKLLPNMPPCILSVLLGVRGPSLVVNPWEGQAAACLMEAWAAVANGEQDAVLVGASDTPTNPSTLVYLRQAGLLGPEQVATSAGCFLVFESRDKAERDQRHIHALVEEVRVCSTGETARDPLEPWLGRTFAALAPLLVATLCTSGEQSGHLVDPRGIALDVVLRGGA